jgi:hypothetical protein
MAKHKAEFVEEQSVRWDKVCIAVLWKKKWKSAMTGIFYT